jgi:nucleoid DNA-binding protein
MTRRDLIRILMNTELEQHSKLTREQARAVVNEIFGTIAEALRNGEVARLPFGNLGVSEQERQPMRGRFLNRLRVLYKQRNRIKYQEVEGVEYDLEPTPPTLSRSALLPPRQPPLTMESKDEMKPSESNSSPPKISPSERRKLIAIAVNADKSLRLIARELNVNAITISRDLKLLGIAANKKPTATRRKPAVVWEDSSRATPDREVASQDTPMPPEPTPPTSDRKVARKKLILPPRPTPRSKNIPPQNVVSEPLKPSQSKPLSPEELRRQRLEEMLKLVRSWLDKQRDKEWEKIHVLDKARNRMAASEDFYIRGLHESPKSAEQLRDDTRPPEMDDPGAQYYGSRREEILALWLFHWLAN